jgi:hypothetical protein
MIEATQVLDNCWQEHKTPIGKLIGRCWPGGVIVIIALLLWAPRLSGPLSFKWDASTYYVLGTALAEGKGYRLLNEPGEIEAVQYPPLLPLIVAAHQRVMSTTDYIKVGSALRITYFVLSVVFLLAAYAFVRSFLSPLYALLIAVITALSYYSFLWPTEILYAELPFAVVSMGFLLCHQRNDQPFFAATSGLLGIAAYLLRTAGLALLLAWVGESLIQRRFRQAGIRAAVAAIPVVLWQAHIWRVTTSDQYQHPNYSYQRADYQYANVTYGKNSRLVDPFRPELGHIHFRTLAGRVARNMTSVPSNLGEDVAIPHEFVPYFLKALKQSLDVQISSHWDRVLTSIIAVCFFAVGLLALAGAVLMAIRGKWFLPLYLAITIAMIVAAPWQSQFRRYLSPLTPLTLLFVLLTLLAVRKWLTCRISMWSRAAGILAISVPFAGILLVQVVNAPKQIRSMKPVRYYDAHGQERVYQLIGWGSAWQALDPAFEWIRRNAKPNAVVATTVPHLAYLRSGHKAVLPPFVNDPNKARQLLDEVPVSYVVVDRFGIPGISEHYAAPVVAHNLADWRLVFTTPDAMARVYERVH